MTSEKVERVDFEEYVLNIEILKSTPQNKKYHDGLETYLCQEITDIFPELDTSKNYGWNELKNILSIRLMDRRDKYQDLEDNYSKLRFNYILSLGLNVSLSLYFLIKWYS